MTAAASRDLPSANPRALSVQRYARIAAVLLLLSLLAGGFGEVYVPSRLIVFSDPAATAQNIRAFEPLLRMGFAGYLVESVCDIALSLIFYVLLRPVQKEIALLAAFFGLVGTAVFANAELFYLAPLLILGGADYLKTFAPEQLNALAFLSLKLFTYGGVMFTVFYGTAWMIRGYLIFKSGYLPKFLGVLLALGGLAFIARNFLLALAPAYAPSTLLLAMLPGALALILWLLVKGVDASKWRAAAAANNLSVRDQD
jgi:hypothetical protein